MSKTVLIQRSLAALLGATVCSWGMVSSALADGSSPQADGSSPQLEPAPRRADASWREIFGGQFRSSRLFAVPTAEVVGAFQMSLSGDASLLTLDNTLSTSSVVALGFGDIAQLEYRNAAAITTLERNPFGLPTVGVQLKAPFRRRTYLPQLAVALRFGLPHEDTAGGITHIERATDLYLMTSLQLWSSLDRVTLHAGLRISAAEIDSPEVTGPADYEETLLLPSGGIELRVNEYADMVAELALVPRFAPGDSSTVSDINAGIFGRAGVRWRMAPSVVFDASVGYRIEIERLGNDASMANAFVDWDIRLGGEIFVPWGAILCKTTRVFCE